MTTQERTWNESDRVAYLRSLDLLDATHDESLDRIVRLATKVTGTPSAAVSIVGDDRVWFKARQGLDIPDAARDLTICSVCMQWDKPLIIEDTLADPAYSDWELVRSLGIRFYAGVPLVTHDGVSAGAICILDTQPRRITEDQIAALKELAAMTADLISVRASDRESRELRKELTLSNKQRSMLSEVAARTDNAVIITDPEGRIEWVNRGCRLITGYSPEESFGRMPSELLSGPGSDAGSLEHLRACILRGEGSRFDLLANDRHGGPFWMRAELEPLRDDRGAVSNMIMIGRDITSEKSRATELERQRSMLESVLNTCMEGVVTFRAVRDQEGRVIDAEYLLVNHSAERMLGRSRTELLGRRLLDCYPNHRRTDIIRIIEGVIESGTPCVNEYDYQDEGIKGWFRNSITRLDDGVVITFSDLSEQKASQREIERSNERFRLLTEATEDIVWDYDIISGKVWWGENLRTSFGHDLPSDQCTVEDWASWVHEDERSIIITGFKNALEGKDSHWTGEYRLRRADGTFAVVLDRGFIIRDEQGRAVRAVGAAIDLTERRTAAERLALQASLLEAQADASPDAILVTDPQGKVVRSNARLRSLTGLSETGLIGADGRAVLAQAVPGSVTAGELIDRIQAHDPTVPSEYRETIGLSDGRWVQLIAEPLNADGNAFGWVWFIRDITKSRRDEQLLRQHNLVVENSKVVLFRWRPEPGWPVELVSENVDQFGYRSDDLLTNKVRFADLIHPEDLERVGREVEGHLRSGVTSFEQEYRIVCKDGRVRWTLDRTVVERDQDGRAISLQGVVVDIDDRKRAEEALQQTEQKLRDITAQVPGAVYQYRLRPDGTSEIPYISEGIRDLLHITPEDVYRDPMAIRSMIPEPEVAGFDRSISESAATMRPWQHEFTVRRKDGELLMIGGRSVPQREPDGSLLWHGVMVDLTERKRAREIQSRLTEALERTNSIAHVGSWEIDTVTNAMWWSDEVFRIHALPPGLALSIDEAIGFYREDARETIASAIRRGMATGEPWDLELPMIRADGREIWVHTQGEVVIQNGRAVRLRGAIQDVTESHLARVQLAQRAEELERLRDEAEAANRAKSEFIANMSHEIRTPLTSILGYTALIRDGDDKAESPEWRRTTAETILAAGDHLMTVINDILDISKVEAGQMTIRPEPVDLARILREAIRISSVTADAKRVQLSAKFEAEIPDRIVIDPTRLRQILMNLLGNAVKFTECGSVTLRIGQHHSGAGPCLVIDIEDTGPGISEEQRHRLFNKFSQADASLTRRHGGTGLGLVLSKHFANLMGGDVVLLSSRTDEGSIFRVSLPLVPAEGAGVLRTLEEPTPAGPTAGPAQAITQDALSGRILLAEDGPDNQRLITFHLRRAGAEVDIAENGVIALELARAAEAEGRPYDLLLTDIQMPEMDGHTLARTLRASGCALPIVALTAHAMPEDRQRCLDAGCDDYATKPIDRLALIRTCARWMTRPDGPARAVA